MTRDLSLPTALRLEQLPSSCVLRGLHAGSGQICGQFFRDLRVKSLPERGPR